MHAQLLMTRLSLALLFAATSLALVWAEKDSQHIERRLVANQEIQKQIDVTVQAYANLTRNAPERMGEAYPELWKLLEMSKFDRVQLAGQLILYEMRMAPREEEKLMWVASLFGIANIHEETLFLAVEPYIGTSDKVLAMRVAGVLSRIDNYNSTSPPNFDFYKHFLLDIKGQKTPLPLIEHMYRKAPGRAMLVCSSVYGPPSMDNAILWGEHVIDDVLWKQTHRFFKADQTTPEAMAELEKLSKHNHWWARLYVAEIMRQEPEFRTNEIIKRLAQDPHPLVRKVVSEIESRKH